MADLKISQLPSVAAPTSTDPVPLVEAGVTSRSTIAALVNSGLGGVPNAGQLPIGNAGGTAYAPVALGGDATLASTGAITISSIGGKTVSLANSLTTSGNFALTLTQTATTNVTLPTTGTLATLAGAEELTNKTLNASVGKGTWTTSGTWTLPAVTLGAAITYGGITLTNAVTGTGKMVLDTAPQISKLGVGQAAGASNPLEITAATDATGIKLLNSSQSPIFDIYTGNADSSARNWRIATNFNAFGALEFIRGTSQGAAPSSTALTLNVSGDVRVNTTDEATSDTAAAFTVAGGAGFSKKIFVSTNLSNAAGTPGSLCYNTSTFEVTKNSALTCTVSASEFKTAIAPLTEGLDVALQMNPSQFAYKKGDGRLRWGFIADELQAVNPKLGDGYDAKGHAKSIDLAAISAIAVKAIQELNDKVDILEKRILVLSENGQVH